MRDLTKSVRKFSDVSHVADHTFVNITDKPFKEALVHWKPLLMRAVKKVSRVSKTEELDVFQDFMMELSKTNSLTKLNLYRYRGVNYELASEAEGGYLLKTVRYKKITKDPFWVAKDAVTPVKQASINYLVFRKIRQCVSVFIIGGYRQKRGFTIQTIKKTIKTKDGKNKTVNRNIPSKFAEVMYLDDVIMRCEESDTSKWEDRIADAKAPSPEAKAIEKDFREKALKSLSPISQNMFNLLCEDPLVCSTEVLSKLSISNKQAVTALREIRRWFLSSSHRSSRVRPFYFTPEDVSC
jgi:hypothetical protein